MGGTCGGDVEHHHCVVASDTSSSALLPAPEAIDGYLDGCSGGGGGIKTTAITCFINIKLKISQQTTTSSVGHTANIYSYNKMRD